MPGAEISSTMVFLATALPGGDISSTIGLFFIMALVLVAAYYTTRFLSMKTRRLGKGSSMQVLDQIYFNRDKHIVLIKVGEKGYIVGITNQSVNVIGTLDQVEMQVLQVSGKQMSDTQGSAAKGLGDFIKNLVNAPEALRRSKMQGKSGEAAHETDQATQEADFEKLISAIQHKKDHFGSGKNGEQP